MAYKIFNWNNADFNWNNNPYTWNEVILITQAASDGIFDVDQWDKEKKKKLVKLICKVKGKTYDESKYVNDFKIKVSDIKLAAKEILGVEIMTENIKF
tara:strand:- start:6221 stop:6514 length:294 start_codon:yes stop_codon:yes gene_type:complete